MPISLNDLVSRLQPQRTSLVLGAGASVPSGAPTGSELAKSLWALVAKSSAESEDLVETASILVRRFGRRTVAEAVVTSLKNLQPTGGILGIPSFPWRGIYTTNFDKLIELAFKRAQIPLTPIRSNYEFTTKEGTDALRLFKIHGCISQDSSFGDKASMILTESDYEEFIRYRQTLFASLTSALLEGDVLVIGQSLRDRHLNDLVKQVLQARAEGAPGKLFVLIYNKDDLRAPLLEDRGAELCFGEINAFIDALASGPAPKVEQSVSLSEVLPSSLVSTVLNVDHQSTLGANTTRMFNGAAATYADIAAKSTFERSRKELLVERLVSSTDIVSTITGAAGVGKTTMARQLMLSLRDAGYQAWEHRQEFPLRYEEWVAIEAKLRQEGKKGALLIDDCTHFLRSTNQLIDHLSGLKDPALKVILTANSSQWTPRIKTRNIFQRGVSVELSKLLDEEIHSLLNLLSFNKSISSLVQMDFKSQTRNQQFDALRLKCSADMFVCLKNIFATESLDVILLAEYRELSDELQSYYRYVAALQAIGTRVHRQLLLRVLNLAADQVQVALKGLHGIVDEYDISPNLGIYGWTTRHLVIARKIAEYKFSGVKELQALFELVIDNINPSINIELQSIRDLCDSDFGIGRLGNPGIRQALYRKLIAIAPGERIPWHRLIRELLEGEDLEAVEFTIRDAQASVGQDAPISRFKVRLLMARAERTKGITQGDRAALLRKAYELASRNTELFRMDKHSFTTLCDAAIKLVQAGESIYVIDEAINKLRVASNEIFDPEIPRRIQHYEGIRYSLTRA